MYSTILLLLSLDINRVWCCQYCYEYLNALYYGYTQRYRGHGLTVHGASFRGQAVQHVSDNNCHSIGSHCLIAALQYSIYCIICWRPILLRLTYRPVRSSVLFLASQIRTQYLLILIQKNTTVLTFFPPDWGMLRRSRCVQIFLLKKVRVGLLWYGLWLTLYSVILPGAVCCRVWRTSRLAAWRPWNLQVLLSSSTVLLVLVQTAV